MSRVLVPLAAGCEELEAVTVIDLLRRAGIEVVIAGLAEGPVRASRGTVLVPDTTLAQVAAETFDAVILPGGLPGADHLAEDVRLRTLLLRHHESGRAIAAICAAPKVLARHGLLDGKRATAFPGVLEAFPEAGVSLSDEPVVVDGTVTTSRGPGTAMDFALELIGQIEGPETRDSVAAQLQRVPAPSSP